MILNRNGISFNNRHLCYVFICFISVLLTYSTAAQDYSNISFDRKAEAEKIMSTADFDELDQKIEEFNQESSYNLHFEISALVKDLSSGFLGSLKNRAVNWENRWLRERNQAVYSERKLNVDGEKKGVQVSALFMVEKAEEEGATWESRFFQFISTGRDVPMTYRSQFSTYDPGSALVYNGNHSSNKEHIFKVINHVIEELSGDPSDKENVIDIGPYAVAFDNMNEEEDKIEVNGNEFVYTTLENPSFILDFNEEDGVEKSYQFDDAEVSFYFNSNSLKYVNAHLSYDGESVDLGKSAFFNTELNSFSIDVNEGVEDGESDYDFDNIVTGEVNLMASLEEDAKLAPLVYVDSEMSGDFTFTFDPETADEKGRFDFSEIDGLMIKYILKDVTVGRIDDVSLTEEGNFNRDFVLNPSQTYQAGNAEIEFTELNLGLNYDLKNNNVRLSEGGATLYFKNIPGVEGYLVFEMIYDPGDEGEEEEGGYTLSFSHEDSPPLSFYGMEIKDYTLEVDVDNKNLDIRKITGFAKVKHPDFNTELELEEFEIEDGIVTKFSGGGEVVFKDYLLNIKEFNYYTSNNTGTSQEAYINCSASLRVRDNWAEITDFTIDNQGGFSIGEVSGHINEGMLTSSFSVSFSEDEFSGYLDADVSGFGFESELVIGNAVTNDTHWGYGYGNLIVNANIPLTPLPVTISSIGGQLGYNYTLEYIDEDNPTEGYTGSPEYGRYLLGLTLGVRVAKLVELEGNSIAQFSEDSFRLDLNGNLNIPSSNPYLEANANVSYRLPDPRITGGFSADLVMPREGGYIIDIKNLGVNFDINRDKWQVISEDIHGTALMVLTFDGEIDFEGGFNEDSKIRGSLIGNATLGFSRQYEFSVTAGSYSFAEAKIGITLDASMGLDVQIDDQQFSGEFMASLNGSGDFELTAFGFNAGEMRASISSSSNAKVTNSYFRINGDVDLTLRTWDSSDGDGGGVTISRSVTYHKNF